MPNVFSPNNDDSNDLFVPVKYKNLKNVKFNIMNHWGNIIFETDELSIDWDGKFKDIECDDGVYFWNIQYTNHQSKDVNKHGHLTLIR
jgi:gliding motility-associated-like protein